MFRITYDYGVEPTLYNRPNYYDDDGEINPDRVRWDAAWAAKRTGEDPREIEKRLWPLRRKMHKKMLRRRRGGFWRNLFGGPPHSRPSLGPGPVSSWYGRR